MLSYRHGFHAGNFADCHKHASLVSVLDALVRKAKPMSLLDAFAGAGEYSLDDEFARKTNEAADGIGRLLRAAASNPAIARTFAAYFDAIGTAPGDSLPNHYPGSPRFLQRAMRAEDELHLLELHPAEHGILQGIFRADERVHVHQRDAREGVAALLPMRFRRGLVLLDPPYERTAEYAEIPALLDKACSRWPEGVYALWYPLLADPARRGLAMSMKETIAASGLRRIYCHELLLHPDAHGMQGSGMLWINLPWQQDEALENLGRQLLPVLADDEAAAGVHAGWLVGE